MGPHRCDVVICPHRLAPSMCLCRWTDFFCVRCGIDCVFYMYILVRILLNPFCNYFTYLLPDLSSLNFEIFIYFSFIDTQGCCVPSQLVKYFMPNVSRKLIEINVCQVHLDSSVGYDFARMLSLLMI